MPRVSLTPDSSTADAAGAFCNALEAGVPSDGHSDATSSIQRLIDSVSAAGGGRIVFPAATYLLGDGTRHGLIAADDVELYLLRGAWLQKSYSAPPGFAGALIRSPLGPSGHVVAVSHFSIAGAGRIGCRSLALAGDIVAVYGDDLRFEGITVDTYGGGDSTATGGRAFQLGGDRIRMVNVVVRNSAVAGGTGGIRMIGGTDFVAMGCHIESGDDALQFVPLPRSTGGVAAELADQTIARGSYVGCTGFSSTGRFMVAELVEQAPGATREMTASIRGCSFIACHGRGTQRRLVVDNSASRGEIHDLAFTDCSIASHALLGKLHAGVGPGARSMRVEESAREIPPLPFLVQLGSERILVTSRIGTRNPFRYGITRGVSGSTPALHGARERIVKLALKPIGPLAAPVTSRRAAALLVHETGAPPAAPFAIQIGSEQMMVTARAEQAEGSVLYTVTRAVNGTTSAKHPLGATTYSLIELLTPSGSGEIWINAANSVGGTVRNIRLHGVRVEEPHYASLSIPAAAPNIGSLAAGISGERARKVDIVENGMHLLADDPTGLVIRVGTEQMSVTARVRRSVNEYRYTVLRGHNGTTAVAHESGEQVFVTGAGISGVLVEGCEFAPGNLDPGVPQAAVDGAVGVALRSCVFAPQARGHSIATFGAGKLEVNMVSDLLVDACRFEGIGANVTALNCNNVVRAAIQANTFVAVRSSGQAIALGSASSGALIAGNSMSGTMRTPVADLTADQDTISSRNLGYSDRRRTRKMTGPGRARVTDEVIWADASGGPLTISLPPAARARGVALTIKKVDRSGSAVTVRRTGRDRIDDAASYVIPVLSKYATFLSDGDSNWFVVGGS